MQPPLCWDDRVEAASVADFLDRYYRPDRYRGRGEEYAAGLLASHQQDFAKHGYDLISRHDSVTGQAVAYFGMTEDGYPTVEFLRSQGVPVVRREIVTEIEPVICSNDDLYTEVTGPRDYFAPGTGTNGPIICLWYNTSGVTNGAPWGEPRKFDQRERKFYYGQD